jgi:hypothetical protein
MSLPTDGSADSAAGQSAPATNRPGRVPEGRIYVEPARLEAELERFFYQGWICVGREEEFAEMGDYRTFLVGRESLLLVRDDAHTIRGSTTSAGTEALGWYRKPAGTPLDGSSARTTPGRTTRRDD